MKQDFVFMSESVTEGHPDKLCDQISDAVLDAHLRLDPFARLVVECALAKGVLFIAARVASSAEVDVPTVARQVITEVGYEGEDFNAKTCSAMSHIDEMPMNEGLRVDERSLDEAGLEAIAARNQVTLFGYACRQTPALMPLPIWLAHRLARRLASVRLQGLLPYLTPDGTTQVGVEYKRRRPHRIHSISLVTALDPASAPQPGRLKDDLMEAVITPAFADEPLRPDRDTRIFINPGGQFLTGGPTTHSGLTGRKNGIDTYGEFARHSGAALSGKDPTRIDRVGAYAARLAAKTVVAAGLAEECEVQLSYTIGLARPVSVQIETFGTGRIDEDEIAARITRHVDLRPAGIVKAFNLRFLPGEVRSGFYRRLAAYGQVGRMDIGLPWETTETAARLAQAG
jgi:S-adenosylmethionine synthetase